MAKKRKSIVEFAKSLQAPRRETWWDRLDEDVQKEFLELRVLFNRGELPINTKEGLAKAIVTEPEYEHLQLSTHLIVRFLGGRGDYKLG